MVTTADSSSNHQSPPSAGFSGDTNSPKFPRKNLPSPWAQVVRGGEPESVASVNNQSPPSSSPSSVPEQIAPSDFSPKAAAPPSSPLPDNSSTATADGSDANNGNAARPKKPAWNKPSNGVVEVGPVMGAVSWPPLSESTKASPKSLAESASKTVIDGFPSTTQGPVASHPPPKQSSDVKANSSTNHAMPNRQRSMKRGGGSNSGYGPGGSSFAHPPPPPPPPPFPRFQVPPTTYGNMVPGNNWDTRPVGAFVSQSHGVNDHRNSSRRGNMGPHSRGDGGYHNNFGGRRDHDRGNYASNRDSHVHQPRVPPRGLVRPPQPNAAAFVTPPPVGPFASPMGFHEFYYFPTLPLEPFRGMPFFTHAPPPAIFYPVAEPPLTAMLINQIDYYFSDANLVKDDFLRSNMDDQGWVPINLIASFPRVRSLTNNVQLILDTLRSSTVVEIQGDKVRRRNEWRKWLSSGQSPTELSQNNLVAEFENLTMDEATTNAGTADSTNAETILGRGSTDSTLISPLPNGDIEENN